MVHEVEREFRDLGFHGITFGKLQDVCRSTPAML